MKEGPQPSPLVISVRADAPLQFDFSIRGPVVPPEDPYSNLPRVSEYGWSLARHATPEKNENIAVVPMRILEPVPGQEIENTPGRLDDLLTLAYARGELLGQNYLETLIITHPAPLEAWKNVGCIFSPGTIWIHSSGTLALPYAIWGWFHVRWELLLWPFPSSHPIRNFYILSKISG